MNQEIKKKIKHLKMARSLYETNESNYYIKLTIEAIDNYLEVLEEELKKDSN